MRAELLDAWTTRHAPLEHDKLPKCEVPSAPMLQVTTCFKAGRCLCEDGTGKGAKALIPHAFRTILLRLFKKGQPHKGLYSRGIAFVNIFSLREGQGTGLWSHLGMGNLRSGFFTLTPLRHHRTLETAVAEVNYHIEDGPLSMYEALLDTVTTVDDWDMELLLADLDDTELVAADFVPNKVRVTPIKPPEVHPLWRQCKQVVGRGRNLPLRGLPHAGPPAIEDGAEQEAEAAEGVGLDDGEGDNIGGDLAHMRQQAMFAWELSEDSENEEEGADLATHNGQRGEGGGRERGLPRGPPADHIAVGGGDGARGGAADDAPPALARALEPGGLGERAPRRPAFPRSCIPCTRAMAVGCAKRICACRRHGGVSGRTCELCAGCTQVAHSVGHVVPRGRSACCGHGWDVQRILILRNLIRHGFLPSKPARSSAPLFVFKARLRPMACGGGRPQSRLRRGAQRRRLMRLGHTAETSPG